MKHRVQLVLDLIYLTSILISPSSSNNVDDKEKIRYRAKIFLGTVLL